MRDWKNRTKKETSEREGWFSKKKETLRICYLVLSHIDSTLLLNPPKASSSYLINTQFLYCIQTSLSWLKNIQNILSGNYHNTISLCFKYSRKLELRKRKKWIKLTIVFNCYALLWIMKWLMKFFCYEWVLYSSSC